jgi:ATP-binding cassette subfamily F protein 3
LRFAAAGFVMLQVQNLHKTFGVTTVLDDLSFVLNDGEHVGLIGPNGSGKSTLLRCIVGAEQPDRGSVVLSPTGARVGYLPQSFAEHGERTFADVQADFLSAEHALQRAADALAQSPAVPTALAEYEAALAHFEAQGGYNRAVRVATVLDGLDLSQIEPTMPVAQLSGGQKTRLGLATLLLSEPDVLLLDEPTNHLDVEALEWLEGFLRASPQAVLVVSHDRAFLDATVSRVLYLDPATRAVCSYRGGYTDFAAARAHERELLEDTWRRQEDYVEQVKRDIGRLKSSARSIEQSTTARQPGLRKFARRKAAVAKSREKKLERYVTSDERVEKPRLHWPINLDFGPPPPGGRAVVRVEDVAFAYPDAPPLFEHVSFELRYGQHAALVGPNGAGKTTLLRLIQGQLEPTSGQVVLGANVRLGVLAQEHETLDPDLTVLETVLRERPMSEHDARSFLPFFLFSGDSVFRPVGACSLGERSRLQLAQLVLRGCTLLLLDEPINHLDVESRDHFETALASFDGTVLVVAHDRAFLRAFARRTFEVRAGRLARLAPR